VTKPKDTGQSTPPDLPDFLPARFSSSWREESQARICELKALADALTCREKPDAKAMSLLAGARAELGHARRAAERYGLVSALTGAAVQRVHAHLDAAEVLVLRGAPLEYVHGQTAALVVHIRRHLVPSDPRCRYANQMLEADEIAERSPGPSPATKPRLLRRAVRRGSASTSPDTYPPQRRLSAADRERLVAAVQGAMAEARNEQMRLRSFRNLLLSSAIGLLVLAVGVCVFGVVAPAKLPVCFQPVQATASATAAPQPEVQRLVCPTRESPLPARSDLDHVVGATVTRWDVPLIAFLGLIAASVATATALRKVRGTNTPYSLPAALAFVKLPLGALTALLGLILMRANFVPGLSALDSSAQIVGWAVVFGYAQQAFTQVVDRKAQNLLEDVGGAEQRDRPAASLPETATARGAAPAP
jgi:hypothetical protein